MAYLLDCLNPARIETKCRFDAVVMLKYSLTFQDKIHLHLFYFISLYAVFCFIQMQPQYLIIISVLSNFCTLDKCTLDGQT